MSKLVWVTLGVLCSAAVLSANPPPGTSLRVLSPRIFPGWQSQNVCYPFVVRDDDTGTYRMYYSGSGSEQWNDSLWDQWVTGAVTSTDTLTWKYPDNYEQLLFARRLLQGDLLDPDEIAGQFDSVFAIGACILKEAGAYKCWYTGWNGQIEHVGGGISTKINFRVGYATSPDGFQWTKVPGQGGAGSVLGLGAAGELDAKGAAHPHVLKIGGEYRMWYEGFDGTNWRLFLATSSDGVEWAKQGLVLNLGGAGSLDERGLRNPMVILRNSQYELWYQGEGSQPPNYRVLRATSADGLSWVKQAGEVQLHPNPPVAGDQRILVDSAIVRPDNSVQVFFAKENSVTSSGGCAVTTNRNYHIFTEMVNP